MKHYNIFCKKHPPGNVIVHNMTFRLNNGGSNRIGLKEDIPVPATYKGSLGTANADIGIYIPPVASKKLVYANAEADFLIGTSPVDSITHVYAEGTNGLLLQAALSTLIYVDVDEGLVIDASASGIVKRYRYLYETDDISFSNFDDLALEDFDYVVLEE